MEWGFVFFFNSVLLGVGLAMDAFSVSMANGLNEPDMGMGRMCGVAGVFAGFQALMPLIGYYLGRFFADAITEYDHWIAFILLIIIGGKMVKESFDKEEQMDGSMSARSMLLLAVATSIDALAVGVTFAFLKVSIIPAVSFIGVVTFVCSAVGVKIGSIFGTKYRSRAELCGGIILILIGTKILLEGVGII